MKRLFIFLLCLVSACAQPKNRNPVVDQAKFQDLYRSAKAIEGATSVGLNRPKFSELLQAYATEISIARDKAITKAEKDFVNLHLAALEVYQDSATVWDSTIEHPSKYGDYIYYSQTIEFIGLKYELGPVAKDISEGMYILPKGTIQYLWSKAGNKVKEANAMINVDREPEVMTDLTTLKQYIYDQYKRELVKEIADFKDNARAAHFAIQPLAPKEEQALREAMRKYGISQEPKK